MRAHRAHALELLAGGPVGLDRQLGAREALAQRLDLVVVVGLAELLADGLHLLTQEELALTARHLLLDHRGDLLLDLVHLRLSRDDLEHASQAIAHLEDLEDLLLGAGGDAEVGGDGVGEGARVVDVLERGAGLAVLLRQHLAQTSRGLAQRRGERVGLGVAHGGLVDALHAAAHERVARERLEHAHARDALEHDGVVARGEADDLEHACDGAERVHVFELGVLRLRLLLRDDADERAIAAEGLLDEAHRASAADVDRHHRRREEDRVAQRQDRQDLGPGRRRDGRSHRVLSTTSFARSTRTKPRDRRGFRHARGMAQALLFSSHASTSGRHGAGLRSDPWSGSRGGVFDDERRGPGAISRCARAEKGAAWRVKFSLASARDLGRSWTAFGGLCDSVIHLLPVRTPSSDAFLTHPLPTPTPRGTDVADAAFDDAAFDE